MQVKRKINKNKTVCVLNFLWQKLSNRYHIRRPVPYPLGHWGLTGIILDCVSGSMVQKTSLRTYLELEVIILPSSFDQGKNNFLFSHESYFSVALIHQFLSAMWLCEYCSHYLGNPSILSSFSSFSLFFKSQFIVTSPGRLPLTYQTRVPLSVALVKVAFVGQGQCLHPTLCS